MRAKKIALLTISLLVIWIYPCSAQQRTIERIYISTDRALYIAGETIWLSLYCFDLSKEMHQFSDLSKVAYVELRNAGSLVTSAKLRIDKGRGGGMLQLPASLPTGNYRLIAYTKQMLNEATPCFFDKVIPIYNTLSTERIDENVFVGDDLLPQTQTEISRISSNHIDVKWNGDKIVMTNKSDQAITLNLSIARVDIPVALDRSIIDFMEVNKPKQAEVTFNTLYIPEYEGEIIRGRVKNVNGVQSREHLIFLSTVGTGIDIYSATADAVTGEFSFFTKSLLEKNEIVLEYPGAAEATFELIDPFVRPPVAPAPPLFLDKTFESALVQRSMEMQVSKYFGIDTLFERVNVPDGPPLFTGKPIIYHLDDYTRFPTMQDIVIEF
ncbi:MAG: hypothetical protein FWD56_07690, partial [Bacteroidales bacterium]|nr:hypothetical protein [Bacteroidales bacterium]